MNLELSLLKSFVAIVDHGNFLAASNAIAKSPAAVSVHIKKLEETLGAPLFDRDARATGLTSAGEKLLPHARRMLALENVIVSDFSKPSIQGTVHLGVPDDVIERFPMHILSSFSNEYPDVRLVIRVDHTPALLKAVDSGMFDLAIITYVEGLKGVSDTEKLMNEPEIWASSANGIAHERSPLPVALWDKGWAWYEPAVKILQDAGLEYSVVLECENISGRKSAIEADLAVGPLPASQLDDRVIPAPGMQDLPPLPLYGLGLKCTSKPNSAVLAVADHLRRHFSQGIKQNR